MRGFFVPFYGILLKIRRTDVGFRFLTQCTKVMFTCVTDHCPGYLSQDEEYPTVGNFNCENDDKP
jgi:hypothetical protein